MKTNACLRPCAPSPYVGYPYAYPHKTAYGALSPPIALQALWANEPKNALSLYFHIPFCERKCSYCNLLSIKRPSVQWVDHYLETLKRQASAASAFLGEASFARIAIGGGTPTYLNTRQLSVLFHICSDILGADPARVPTSVEISPNTATPNRLNQLKARGVDRISIGIQSFIAHELALLGRAGDFQSIPRALDNIRHARFNTCNIDLIYGIPGQTIDSWLESLDRAIAFEPEELFLYPLYVRPLTRLYQIDRMDQFTVQREDLRLHMYRRARSRLLEAGYLQESMRMFRAKHAPGICGPEYCCQEDGMLGLGCGPRSYTTTVHYSDAYATSQEEIRNILMRYMTREDDFFRYANHGIRLTEDDRKRRYLIKSLLKRDGVTLQRYTTLYRSDLYADFPILETYIRSGLVIENHGILRLTDAGMEQSDAIGPMLYSDEVVRRMNRYRVR